MLPIAALHAQQLTRHAVDGAGPVALRLARARRTRPPRPRPEVPDRRG